MPFMIPILGALILQAMAATEDEINRQMQEEFPE